MKNLREKLKWHYIWVLRGALLLTIALIIIVRIRFLGVPLERDEGEYAYMAQLMLDGVLPYLLAYSMKLPGIYVVYALIMLLFGQTIAGIHLGLLGVNVATIILIYFVGKRLMGECAGVISGISFAMFSISPWIQSLWANSEHFVILPAVGGLLLLLKAYTKGRPSMFFLSGLLFGFAIIVKQHGMFFAIFAILYTFYLRLSNRSVVLPRLLNAEGLLAVGVAVPYVVTCAILLAVGVFEKFWFWTVKYASEYTSLTTLPFGIENFNLTAEVIGVPVLPLWFLSAFGLTAFIWDRKSREHAAFLVGLLVFSFLAGCPGLYFRQHYFILLLPAASLFVARSVVSINRVLRESKVPSLGFIPVIIFIFASNYGLYTQEDLLFKTDGRMLCRAVYGHSPFPESIEIAKYIRRHTTERDRIVVFGSEPQIPFYAHRRSAVPYIYTYPLMGVQKYAVEMCSVT
ncbi:MAG: glycosyltransferase family 39 protein [Armatimonadetes bacterium]|nr:glycosyltransferase family 39 protein [Armatimonadota bacterium]